MQRHVSVPNAATIDPMAEAHEAIKAVEAQVQRIASLKAVRDYVGKNDASIRDCVENMRGALTNFRDGLEAFHSRQMGSAMGFAAAASVLSEQALKSVKHAMDDVPMGVDFSGLNGGAIWLCDATRSLLLRKPDIGFLTEMVRDLKEVK